MRTQLSKEVAIFKKSKDSEEKHWDIILLEFNVELLVFLSVID